MFEEPHNIFEAQLTKNEPDNSSNNLEIIDKTIKDPKLSEKLKTAKNLSLRSKEELSAQISSLIEERKQSPNSPWGESYSRYLKIFEENVLVDLLEPKQIIEATILKMKVDRLESNVSDADIPDLLKDASEIATLRVEIDSLTGQNSTPETQNQLNVKKAILEKKEKEIREGIEKILNQIENLKRKLLYLRAMNTKIEGCSSEVKAAVLEISKLSSEFSDQKIVDPSEPSAALRIQGYTNLNQQVATVAAPTSESELAGAQVSESQVRDINKDKKELIKQTLTSVKKVSERYESEFVDNPDNSYKTGFIGEFDSFLSRIFQGIENPNQDLAAVLSEVESLKGFLELQITLNERLSQDNTKVSEALQRYQHSMGEVLKTLGIENN